MDKLDTGRYVVDGQLDVDLIRREHPCRGETCRRCAEATPCSIRHVADRIARFRDRPRFARGETP